MKLFLQTSAGTKLVLRCIVFDTYHIAIGPNCIEFDTRFNVNKYITSLLLIKMLKAYKRVETLNHNYYYINNPGITGITGTTGIQV